MFFDVGGSRVHALTGGAAFDPSLPSVVFLHGAGMDATIWSLQTRWFAHHGFSVLALDFAGHGRSEGAPLSTIEAMADWVSAALLAVAAPPTAVVGHSMGSLVALALAANHPERVSRLALMGTALEMKVGPDLQASADAGSAEAIDMVNLWGHGSRAELGHAETPGVWMTGCGQRLLERANPGVLASGLRACAEFKAGPIAAKVGLPTLILQGSRDMMTPLKAARALAAALSDAKLKVFPDAGHMIMIENGGAILAALASDFGHEAAKPTATQPVGAPP